MLQLCVRSSTHTVLCECRSVTMPVSVGVCAARRGAAAYGDASVRVAGAKTLDSKRILRASECIAGTPYIES